MRRARSKTPTDPLDGDGLTAKQRLFCLEYLANGCKGARAARSAGYSPECAKQQALENLRKPAIRRFLEKRLEKRVARLELKAERLDQELARCAYVDPGQLQNPETGEAIPLHELPEDVRRAVRSVKIREIWTGRGKDAEQIGQVVEIRLEPKVEAIGLAYKRLGLLKDRVEVETTLSHEQLLVLAEKLRERKRASVEPPHHLILCPP